MNNLTNEKSCLEDMLMNIHVLDKNDMVQMHFMVMDYMELQRHNQH